MRLYRRSKQIDLTDTIALCDFDADNGRLKLALERLRDLEEEIGSDAKICYAEGLLRKDFLGQGQKAYECFVRAMELDPRYVLAACNAAAYAPSEAAFREWGSVACRLSPKEESAWQIRLQLLKECASYQNLQRYSGARERDEKNYGTSAAFIELALLDGGLEEAEEAGIRRVRAQSLRAIDQEAESSRGAAGEAFPPEERLSLQEAVLELDRAITLDDYDAELWNLRSAWCVLLERYDEAIAAADRAIALRPSGYPKPFQNKASALWNLNRDEEALAMITRAKEEAQIVASARDLQLAQSLLAEMQAGRGDSSEEMILHTAGMILKGAEVRTSKFAGLAKGTVLDLCRAFETRVRKSRPETGLDYVPAVAQLLAYYPVDASATVLRNVRRSDPPNWNHYFEALCYAVANAEPVMQQDAARVAALLILDEPSLARMRDVCREYVIAPSAAAPSEFGLLKKLVGEALRRLNSGFPKFLLEQPPLGVHELQAARDGMLVRLSGTPFVNDSATFQQLANRLPVFSLAIRYALVFLPSLFILQSIISRLVNSPFALSAVTIGSAILAFGLGTSGLGAAAIAAYDGALPTRGRPKDKLHLSDRSIRFWSRGPFQPLPIPHPGYATMFFLAYFFTLYWLLWFLENARAFGLRELGLLVVAPSVAAVIASRVILRPRSPYMYSTTSCLICDTSIVPIPPGTRANQGGLGIDDLSSQCFRCAECGSFVCSLCRELDRQNNRRHCPKCGKGQWTSLKYLSGPNAVSLGVIDRWYE